jgi:hypothetical protein
VNWYYGSGTPGPNEFDFRSNGAHEVGHGLALFHLIDFGDNCGQPRATMCATLDPGTTGMRTLTDDDIDAANRVYPQ